MLLFNKGSPPFKNQEQIACPDSWIAISLYSYLVSLLFLYNPAIILSEAISKSFNSIYSLFSLTAKIAASLHKFDISAPENYGVRIESLFEYSEIFIDGSN